MLSASARERLCDTIMQLERLDDAAAVVAMTEG
jgi:hypothetical protein